MRAFSNSQKQTSLASRSLLLYGVLSVMSCTRSTNWKHNPLLWWQECRQSDNSNVSQITSQREFKTGLPVWHNSMVYSKVHKKSCYKVQYFTRIFLVILKAFWGKLPCGDESLCFILKWRWKLNRIKRTLSLERAAKKQTTLMTPAELRVARKHWLKLTICR